MCGASELPSAGCVTSSSWRHAAAVCAAEGARLCTLAEVVAGEAAGTGCGWDNEVVWTATVDVCGQGSHMAAAGTPSMLGTNPPQCSDDGTDHKVRCCADADVGSVCEIPCTSGRSCAELGWAEPSGSLDHVCGSVGSECAHLDYAGAEALCVSQGARLCTVEEIGSGEASRWAMKRRSFTASWLRLLQWSDDGAGLLFDGCLWLLQHGMRFRCRADLDVDGRLVQQCSAVG